MSQEREPGNGGVGANTSDGRLDAPAFHRNHGPILEVLRRHLAGSSGLVLEIGSGTGQHVVAFAEAFPALVWQPSDIDERHLASIAAWRRASGLANIASPARLDATAADWPAAIPELATERLRALIAINVVHIAPWRVAEGLFAGAERHLRAGDGLLVLYGPYKRDGAHTAPSNAAFDASLRRQNPAWGVRDVADVAALGRRHGLALEEINEMPANNLTLVFRRS